MARLTYKNNEKIKSSATAAPTKRGDRKEIESLESQRISFGKHGGSKTHHTVILMFA